jgi:transcriptional regulator with XRE-family HTH domain
MNIDFSKNLLKARQNLKLSQKELAEKANVSPASLSSYEQRGKFPSLDVAARIADALEVSLDWLVGREKEKKSIQACFATLCKVPQSPENRRFFNFFIC